MNEMNRSANVDMLINFCWRIIRVAEEVGEGEEVKNYDVFVVGMLWYFFV